MYAPPGLPAAEYDAMRQALDDKHFQADLRRITRDICRQYPALAKARIKLTR